MRILIPILNFGRGGGNRVLSELANNWVSLGHEVTFLCHLSSGDPYFPTCAKILWFNSHGEIVHENNSTYMGMTKQLLLQYSLLKALNKIKFGIDYIVANHFLTAWPVSMTKLIAKKIYYIQAYEVNHINNKTSFIKKFILRRFIISTYKLNNLLKIVNSPIFYDYKEIKSYHFVPAGINLNIFYAKEIPTQYKKCIKIGAIGRIEPYKGTSYVVDAIRKLNQLGNERFHFELHLAYTSVEIQDDFIYTVKPNNDRELSCFYRSLDILVAPGTVEYGAIHYPVIEAMACGVPVITTYYYPSCDLNSWMVSPHSAAEIVESVLKIANNYEKTIKKIEYAKNSAQEFEWEKVSKKFLDIMHKC